MSMRPARCPFCAGFAAITAASVPTGIGDELVFHGIAECTQCWCRLTTPVAYYSVPRARKAALRLWNTRKES